MVTLEFATAYLRAHYAEDLELVDEDEVEHILSGGSYGHTEGAQFNIPWETIGKIATVVGLLQFAGAVLMKGYEIWKDRRKAADEARAIESIRKIRSEVIGAVAEKYGILIKADDPIISDEAIRRAIDAVAAAPGAE